MTEKTYEPYNKLTPKELMINLGIAAVVLVTGVILLLFNLNEVFVGNNEVIVKIFEVITMFGDEYLYIVFFCVFYFGIDKRFAKRQLFVIAIALHLTELGKALYEDPRPPSNEARGDGAAGGWGFPSGHSSGILSFWGYVLFNLRGEKKHLPWRILAMFLIIAVPISRLVIGVHDLQDVIGGVVLGLVVVSLYMYYEPKVRKMTENWSLKRQIGTGVAMSLGLWIVSSLYLFLVNYHEGIPDLKGAIYVMGFTSGMLCGGAIGFPLEEKYVKFDPRKLIWWKKLISIVIGLALSFGFFLGADVFFGLFPSVYFITRCFKYLILMVVAGFVAPWLLKKIFK